MCHLSPPATRSSAAYTDLPHLGHLGCSTGLKGILSVTEKKKKKEEKSSISFQIDIKFRNINHVSGFLLNLNGKKIK